MSDIRKSLILAAINNKAVALTDEFGRHHDKQYLLMSPMKNSSNQKAK
jgi:hypothetical protein